MINLKFQLVMLVVFYYHSSCIPNCSSNQPFFRLIDISKSHKRIKQSILASNILSKSALCAYLLNIIGSFPSIVIAKPMILFGLCPPGWWEMFCSLKRTHHLIATPTCFLFPLTSENLNGYHS